MDANKVVKVLRKYKKCPKCNSSWKENKLKSELRNEIITLSCKCGFYKQVDENNKEI